MGKKDKNVRICENYAKHCPFANRCESCRYRAMKLKMQNGKGILELVGCKIGHSIDSLPEEKKKCFYCASEGTERCKGDYLAGR